MSSIAIVTPFTDRWFFSTLLDGAATALDEAGFASVVRVHAPGPDARADAVHQLEQDLAEGDVSGALIAGFHLDSGQARTLLEAGKPLVAIGGVQPGFPTVMIDDIGSARVATDHLIRQGHRRILYLGGLIDGQMDFAVHSRRRKGYAVAMAAAGLEPEIVEVPFDADAAYAAAAVALDAPNRPTAIFAVCDEMALPAIEAVRDAGLRLGDDVSVVGFDDHPLAAAAGLTTIRQDPRALGAAAARLLLARLADRDGDHGSQLMATPLVERTSVRPASLLRRAS